MENEMNSLEILVAPDPRLQEKAMPIEKVDRSIRELMDQLLETMHFKQGVGLAATQVGINKRVIVIDLGKEGFLKPFLMANPELLWTSSTTQAIQEGCLSVPGHYADVVRPQRVRLTYLDENNKKQQLEASDLLASCVQHEIDHLNGVLFINHLSFLKRKFILNKLIKEQKYNQGPL